MIRQTDFDPETGLPRWGCKIMSWIRGVWKVATGKEPERDLVLCVLNDALLRPAVHSPGETVITRKGPAHQLYLWDPTALMKLTLSYHGDGWDGAQWPDQRCWHPAYSPPGGAVPRLPWDVPGLAGTIVQFARPSPDGHWMHCDAQGLHVLYDPDPSLGVDGWRRTGQWRGLRVWHNGTVWSDAGARQGE